LEVRILLRALDRDMANAWREAFDDVANVDIQVGDILKAAADAIVSPSNSFGYMDAVVDRAPANVQCARDPSLAQPLLQIVT
jgi:hypothetical protein